MTRLRVLLDENLPHALRNYLAHHDTMTAAYAGFGSFKNGELLKAAETAAFDVLVTADKTLRFEQNLSGRKLCVISVSTNSWRIIKPHIGKIIDAVDASLPGTLALVDCGLFVRQKRPPRPAPG